MQDSLRDRVAQAVAHANDVQVDLVDGSPPHLMVEPEPPRLFGMADLELILARHRRLARSEGYQEGRAHGYSYGQAQTQLEGTRRLAMAATQIIGRLNAVVDGVLDALEGREDEGKRDKRSREAIRLEAQSVLEGASEIRDVLTELVTLVNP